LGSKKIKIMQGATKKVNYTAKEIQILGGLEPIRKRPGMYIGSTGSEGYHHLLKEIVYNSIDEAIAGFCSEVKVTLLSKKKVMVEDNGRGIPVDIHPKTKRSALETVITTLHAGAKFGGKVYTCSGGLHGIGISAVCALSEWMKVEVQREGYVWVQEYSRGKSITKLKKAGKTDKTGTRVIFQPDSEIFKKISFDSKKIIKYLRQQAYLTPKLKIVFTDKTQTPIKNYTFYFEGGIIAYVNYLTKREKPIHENVFYTKGEKEGIIVEAAFKYTTDYETYEESFANNVFTPEGGTHLTGLRIALTKTLNEYGRKKEILKEKNENLSGEDIREGLTAVVSIKIKEPQFEGQTKAKLGNPEAKSAVEKVVSEGLFLFLEKNPSTAKAILEKCILAQRARKAAKAAKETILKKAVLEGLSLPGKLADCISRKPEERELFIVEGDSAGGTSKQARDRHFQAILPIKGKILNVEKASLDKILASKEIKAIIIALGTAIAEDFNLEKLRYQKIIIACDADIDGNHIRTLLLTLFYRYFKPIIEKGFLYVAQPPLYKIKAGKETFYAFNDEEKEKFLRSLKNKRVSIQRYKGLGEMNPQELWETTMDPEKRVLIKVKIEDAKEADRVFDILMGKEVLPRKKFIQIYAKRVKNLDI
jgi:DNA gyrase subunit B